MRHHNAFTLVELIVVIAIIIVLAGLVLATSGYITNKAKRSRAEAEIAAMSAALESYKADNGIYPCTAVSDSLDARSSSDPANYQAACANLYAQLIGDSDYDGVPDSGTRPYMAFKPSMKSVPNRLQPPSATNKAFVQDPFGNSYGYSTAYAKDIEVDPNAPSPRGYNPTYDLWSIANAKPRNDSNQWIRNW